MRAGWAVVVCAAVAGGLGCDNHLPKAKPSAGPTVARAGEHHRPERLAHAFLSVVFGLEYGSRHNDSHRVKKYVGEVRFLVVDETTRGRRDAAEAFLKTLPGRIRNLRASVVDDPARANFRVYLVDQTAFHDTVRRVLRADALAMGAQCIVGVQTVEGRILASTAVIAADDDYLFDRCLVEEVLQGLGPMNDNDGLVESVFNDTSRHSTFNQFDAALLNMLYHPAIRPGMTGVEVQAALPGVMHDLGLAH